MFPSILRDPEQAFATAATLLRTIDAGGGYSLPELIPQTANEHLKEAAVAQIDPLRRGHVRQAQAIGARQDGDDPGARGRSVCRSHEEARHPDRPERCAAQERIFGRAAGKGKSEVEEDQMKSIVASSSILAPRTWLPIPDRQS